MSWWGAITFGAQELNHRVKWVWNKVPLAQAGTFTIDTGFHALEQVLALRKAIPALGSPESQTILTGIKHTVLKDILPVAGVHFVNNCVQNYLGGALSQTKDAAWYTQYAAFLSLSALSVINYAVIVYTWQQATKLLVHTAVLDSMGPSAFIEYKNKLPPEPSLCTELDCNFKRKFKGSVRQPVMLAINDMITALTGYFIPYVGEHLAKVLAIYFYGEYITRMVTPSRCERHKGMDRSSLLALGLSFKASTMLLDRILNATTGMPPYLYYRTLTHFLLLLHINLAAHMTLPLVRPEKNTLSFNPLDLYETASRYTVDTFFSFTINTVKTIFKPEPNKEPFLPLSSLLQFLSKIFDSDTEKEIVINPGLFRQTINKTMPKLFHSMSNIVTDPVIRLFWTDIQRGILFSIDIIELVGQPIEPWVNGPKPIAVPLKWTLPTLVYYRFGLAPGLTKNLLKLCKEEDFWNFLYTLRRWCLRNSARFNVVLTSVNAMNLIHGDNRDMTPPEEPQNPSLPPVQELLPTKTHVPLSADQLITQKPAEQKSAAGHASSLFSQRKNQVIPGNNEILANNVHFF